MELKDTNVIYFGGFGGIGQKCIPEFLKKSIKHLIIFDLKENNEMLINWRDSYKKTCQIDFVAVDITNKENIVEAYKMAIRKMNYIDIVVNGCGIMDDSKIDLSIDINLRGLIHSSMIALSYMDKSKGGRGGVILNISSVVGIEPSAMFAAYSATKHGVTAFSRAMAHPLYFNKTGVNFITICPGLTETALLQDISDKTTLKAYTQAAVERFAKIKTQPPIDCAKKLIEIIEINKLGSVWLVEFGDIKEIEIPTLWMPTLRE